MDSFLLHRRKLLKKWIPCSRRPFLVLGNTIVNPYMSFDNGKHVWDALETMFGISEAKNLLYVMQQ
jgi:hypothetical protein